MLFVLERSFCRNFFGDQDLGRCQRRGLASLCGGQCSGRIGDRIFYRRRNYGDYSGHDTDRQESDYRCPGQNHLGGRAGGIELPYFQNRPLCAGRRCRTGFAHAQELYALWWRRHLDDRCRRVDGQLVGNHSRGEKR